MTGTIRNAHAQTLCILAQEDESVLRLPLPDRVYGFHAQQSCEKFFKALISSHGRVYPFTHSLRKLMELLEECGETYPNVPYDVTRLELFAVRFRYDVGGRLSETDRIEIQESIATIRGYTLRRIWALEADKSL